MAFNGKVDLKEPLLENQDSVTVNVTRSSVNGDKKIGTVTFKTKGIECASCATSIQSALGELDGIETVVVSAMDGNTVVKYMPKVVDVRKFF